MPKKSSFKIYIVKLDTTQFRLNNHLVLTIYNNRADIKQILLMNINSNTHLSESYLSRYLPDDP